MGVKQVDQQLVEQVQQGDKRAYDLLVRKYQHRISRVVARYVDDASEVLDVTQEVFIKAYRALAGFRGDSAFYTWLYRIAINTARNHLIDRGRRPPDSDIDADEALQSGMAVALQSGESPERLLLRDEIEATIHRAIEELPEELRSAITLRELEGLSYEDIATVMGCPIGTVRSRIFRAREAIERRIKPLLEP